MENEFDLRNNERESKTHFFAKDCEPGLVSKQRRKETWKWSVGRLTSTYNNKVVILVSGFIKKEWQNMMLLFTQSLWTPLTLLINLRDCRNWNQPSVWQTWCYCLPMLIYDVIPLILLISLRSCLNCSISLSCIFFSQSSSWIFSVISLLFVIEPGIRHFLIAPKMK